MAEPSVTFILSVACDERLQALRGEAAVVAGDATIWQGRIPNGDVEGHISWAIVELARQAQEALDGMTAAKEEEAPPPQPRRPARKRVQPGKDTGKGLVSRSRRL